MSNSDSGLIQREHWDLAGSWRKVVGEGMANEEEELEEVDDDAAM